MNSIPREQGPISGVARTSRWLVMLMVTAAAVLIPASTAQADPFECRDAPRVNDLVVGSCTYIPAGNGGFVQPGAHLYVRANPVNVRGCALHMDVHLDGVLVLRRTANCFDQARNAPGTWRNYFGDSPSYLVVGRRMAVTTWVALNYLGRQIVAGPAHYTIPTG